MTEATTRADILAIVQGVPNIGQVYDYERLATTWDRVQELFTTIISGSTVIRGWTISVVSWTETQETLGNPGSVRRDYQYKIRGFAGIDDANASEKVFIIVVEALMVALQASVDTDSDDEFNMPADLTTFGHLALSDALCHYAEITLQVTEYI